MNEFSPAEPVEAEWPVLPGIPEGMAVKVRKDEALAALLDAEDKVEAAEKARDEAVREDKRHDLEAASMPLVEWNARARELEAARRGAERLLALALSRRDEARQDHETAEIAFAQQALHTTCRRSNELLLDLARQAEAIEATVAAWNVAVPDKSLRITRRDQLFRLLSSITFRATDHPVSTVTVSDAREFARDMIATPSDTMFQRVAETTRQALQGHWVRCRETDPARYRSERGRRKLGGKGGIKKNGEDPEASQP